MRISMSGRVLGAVIGYLELLQATLQWLTRHKKLTWRCQSQCYHWYSFSSMHVVKACNTRHANFHVLTSARSGYWLFRDTTSYTTIAYKALKTNLKVSEPMLPLIFFLSMHVVKVCNPRNANFHVRTSFRSGHWLFRVTTCYTPTP